MATSAKHATVGFLPRNITFGPRGVLDRPRENIKTTCNHCITVCSGPAEARKKWMDLLFHSGVVEQDEKGQEVVRQAAHEDLLERLEDSQLGFIVQERQNEKVLAVEVDIDEI